MTLKPKHAGTPNISLRKYPVNLPYKILVQRQLLRKDFSQTAVYGWFGVPKLEFGMTAKSHYPVVQRF